MLRRIAGCFVVWACAGAGVPLVAQEPPAASVDTAPPPSATAALYPGFSGYARPVTTSSPEAQRWFDQGIQLLYGFNHDEAIRSFERAAQIDPSCAMAWWGSAYARGLHINNPEMGEEQSRAAHQAAQRALAALDDESAVEQALVKAVAERYQWPAPEDRRPLDERYAEAMESVWHRHPGDPDVAALYAEALMNLQPWDLWTGAGQPKGRVLEILAVLERTLAHSPNHPGANHFYIHAIEASPWPEKGSDAAERLQRLVPGSGHLVHMPSHIFIRTGRYAEAADANERAIAADESYFTEAPAPDFYSLYFVHNVHFLAYAAMMEGRYQTALDAARKIERTIPPEFLKEYVTIADGFMPTTFHVMIRFGKWHEIEQLERVASQLTDQWKVGNNSASEVLAVAVAMAEGELAFHQDQHERAFERLRHAVGLEEKLSYDEPPGWMQPVRHSLGALLLAAGRHAEAEEVYRADLELHPENAWSLLGLQQSLQLQSQRGPAENRASKGGQAEALAARVARAWARADAVPVASCYCHPDAISGKAD